MLHVHNTGTKMPAFSKRLNSSRSISVCNCSVSCCGKSGLSRKRMHVCRAVIYILWRTEWSRQNTMRSL